RQPASALFLVGDDGGRPLVLRNLCQARPQTASLWPARPFEQSHVIGIQHQHAQDFRAFFRGFGRWASRYLRPSRMASSRAGSLANVPQTSSIHGSDEGFPAWSIAFSLATSASRAATRSSNFRVAMRHRPFAVESTALLARLPPPAPRPAP